MNWTRASKHHITDGDKTISKALVGERVKYTAWLGGKMLGTFDDVESAKSAFAVRRMV